MICCLQVGEQGGPTDGVIQSSLEPENWGWGADGVSFGENLKT